MVTRIALTSHHARGTRKRSVVLCAWWLVLGLSISVGPCVEVCPHNSRAEQLRARGRSRCLLRSADGSTIRIRERPAYTSSRGPQRAWDGYLHRQRDSGHLPWRKAFGMHSPVQGRGETSPQECFAVFGVSPPCRFPNIYSSCAHGIIYQHPLSFRKPRNLRTIDRNR